MTDLDEENRVLRERVAQLERALQEGGDPFLRALGEHAAAYLNVITPDGRSIATGRPSEGFGSVIGRSVFEFVNPEYHAMMREVLARVAESGRSETYEIVGYGEDGEPGHTYLTKVVALREADRTSALLLVPTDITERVRLERSLIEQQETLRLAVEATGIGLWRWNVATNEITWNDRLREIFGVAETPADYEAYMSLLHPDDRELVDRSVRNALETGVYPTFEHRVAARADAPERWLLAVGSVSKDQSGAPTVLMGGAVDITEQKQVAARMHRAERVEAVGQLTAGIAHNFNNLLAAILPNIELALSRADPAQHAHLTAALDASLQARELVRSLMSLTRRDGARGSAPAHPEDVVKRVISLCQVTFPREIDLRHTVAPAAGHVGMSVGDLEQALLNLLFNARDAIEIAGSGRREIQVQVDRVLDQAGSACVRVRVSDTGNGMSEAVRARVFEPFFTTKPPHKGSGLGLSNVAQRVREAKGTITCESREGVGSTFTLLLPIETSVAATPEQSLDAGADARSAVVLVVDDEPMVRKVVRHLLERENHTVLEAESAHTARTILETEGARVDVIILDQSMPNETGVEALPTLRKLSQAPVLLFTGMAPDLPAGFSALLDKPARPAELYRVLRDLLAKRAP